MVIAAAERLQICGFEASKRDSEAVQLYGVVADSSTVPITNLVTKIFVMTHLFLNGSRGLPSSHRCSLLIIIELVQFNVQ
jgi:hypothetical protein